MQLFALDDDKRLVSARNGHKGTDYFCRECRSPLRIRGGLHTQLHFYHFAKSSSCRQSQKSIYHIQTQQFILRMIGDASLELEKQFVEIGRIADVVWERKKLIFEVQCSPISKEEVEQRNKDYMSLGYKVIWILHEMRFNRFKVSYAEIYLRKAPHYFTNIDQNGEGCIYDQIDSLKNGLRKRYGKKMEVRLDLPQMNSKGWNLKHLFPVPAGILTRIHHWPIYFSGDFLDLSVNGGDLVRGIFAKAIDEERSSTWKYFYLVDLINRGIEYLILRPYKIIFNAILERTCR